MGTIGGIMNRVLVSDLMARDPVVEDPDATLLECARKMLKKRVSSLILTENKWMRGFITIQDILWALVRKPNHDISEIKASDISPRKVVTIKPEAGIEEAAKRMKKYKFYRLPVVKNGNVVGLITMNDLLGFYPELHKEFRDLKDIREETGKIKGLWGARELAVSRDGICEECGERRPLYRMNGMLVCASCMSKP